ncbi:A-kinase anchor protein 6-like [Lethenteron reissneri]|uniref:A-kinase anchor protein 6-like n=1 Tax=Lethenteron reissneri TaxID=7753 RepID=UPI002AB7B6A3|nr:A-kinase anchor protein 6-like [Lethenteron reissneri]
MPSQEGDPGEGANLAAWLRVASARLRQLEASVQRDLGWTRRDAHLQQLKDVFEEIDCRVEAAQALREAGAGAPKGGGEGAAEQAWYSLRVAALVLRERVLLGPASSCPPSSPSSHRDNVVDVLQEIDAAAGASSAEPFAEADRAGDVPAPQFPLLPLRGRRRLRTRPAPLRHQVDASVPARVLGANLSFPSSPPSRALARAGRRPSRPEHPRPRRLAAGATWS